jgi:hypothetical protein
MVCVLFVTVRFALQSLLHLQFTICILQSRTLRRQLRPITDTKKLNLQTNLQKWLALLLSKTLHMNTTTKGIQRLIKTILCLCRCRVAVKSHINPYTVLQDKTPQSKSLELLR